MNGPFSILTVSRSITASSGWGDDFEQEKGGLKELSMGTETLKSYPKEGGMSNTEVPPSNSGMHILWTQELLGHY
ncbi:hypothetical protein L484_017927 [Morus notabilis]|uniref:Uncharacterized protein n=1 Tax=Morus notabilis TaxID=981085 RepID=W9R955_9ROSA|nr:hypothetical protein L484_017927 [Morus notabilis]